MEQFVKQINDRGVVTIPAEVRKFLAIAGNDHIIFKITDKKTVEVVKAQINDASPKTKK